MPFLKCPQCEVAVYYRTASSVGTRTCSHCGGALSRPARQLSTAELRMRRRAKRAPLMLEHPETRLRATS